jgi:UDPglucose 6-dehydrogenase
VVQRNVTGCRPQFTTDVERAVARGTLQFIAVGTPPDEDGSVDLQHVLAAARNIGRLMTDYKVVIAHEIAKRGLAMYFAWCRTPSS